MSFPSLTSPSLSSFHATNLQINSMLHAVAEEDRKANRHALLVLLGFMTNYQ
jgi:hypothetical protein